MEAQWAAQQQERVGQHVEAVHVFLLMALGFLAPQSSPQLGTVVMLQTLQGLAPWAQLRHAAGLQLAGP